MSKKETVVPNFKFTYGFLKQLADSTILLIDRDIIQFTNRGTTAKKQMNVIKVTATTAMDTDRNTLEKQMWQPKTFLAKQPAYIGNLVMPT